MSLEQRLDQIEAQLKNLTKEQGTLKQMQEVLAVSTESVRSLQKDIIELINIVHDSQIGGFKAVDKRIALMDKKIAKLAKNANVEFGTVKGKLNDLHSEIKKISTITGYEEQYKNLLKIVK
jgi:DNA-binding CsgD family transcriptional regulator